MGYLAARLGKDQPTKAEREQLINTLRDTILCRCAPQAIYVFGSILGEQFSRASDIDCAVIFADRTALTSGRKQLFCNPPLVDHPYDVLLYDQVEFARKANEGGICQVIQDSGRNIYDQKSKV